MVAMVTNSTLDSPSDSPRSEPSPGREVGRALAVTFGLVILLIGLAALAWTVGRSTDTTTEAFSGTIDRLVIEVNGRVSISAAESTEVTVNREWLLTGAPTVDQTQDGGTLRVSANCGFMSWWCQTHVTATAPASTEVVVVTSAGDVTVTGFENGVDLTTSAGNVIIDAIGPATMRSSAGRIEGRITDGNVDATTSAGRIELTVTGEFNRISAVTSAGAVLLTVQDDVYRVDADTSAGNVRANVSTDPDAAREIVARSSAGNITIDRTTE